MNSMTAPPEILPAGADGASGMLDTIRQGGSTLIAEIEALAIRDQETLDVANSLLGRVMGFSDRWLALTQPAVDAATQSLEAARVVRDSMLVPARAAAKAIKLKMVDYDAAVRAAAEAERRRVAEEQRRLQAEADARARAEEQRLREAAERLAAEETARRQAEADLEAALRAEEAGEATPLPHALDFTPVESSSLAALAYDPATLTLGVRFRHGGEYHYDGVPTATWETLRSAPSVGAAFHKLIKVGGFASRTVTVEPVVADPVAPVAVEPVFVPPPIVATPARAAGLSFRDNWTAEVVDLKRLAKAVAEGQAPVDYLLPNLPILNARARQHKQESEFLPGVKAVNNRTAAKRGT